MPSFHDHELERVANNVMDSEKTRINNPKIRIDGWYIQIPDSDRGGVSRLTVQLSYPNGPDPRINYEQSVFLNSTNEYRGKS